MHGEPGIVRRATLAIGGAFSNSVKATRANEFLKWGNRLPFGSAMREERLSMASGLFREVAASEMKKGDVKEAVGALNGLAEMHGSRAKALKGVGEFERAAEEYGNQGKVYGEIAEVLRKDDDKKGEMDACREQISAYGNAVGAMEKQVGLLKEGDDYGALSDAYEQMIAAYSNIEDVFWGLGDSKSLAETCEKRIAVYEAMFDLSKKTNDPETSSWALGMQAEEYNKKAEAHMETARRLEGSDLRGMTDECTGAADAFEARVRLLQKTSQIEDLADERENIVNAMTPVVEKWKWLAKGSSDVAPNLVVEAYEEIIGALDRIAGVRQKQANDHKKMTNIEGEVSAYGLMADALKDMADAQRTIKEYRKAGETYAKAVKALEKKGNVLKKHDDYAGVAGVCQEKADVYACMTILFGTDLQNQGMADKARRKRINELGKKGDSLKNAGDYGGAAEAYGEQAKSIDGLAFELSLHDDISGRIGALGKQVDALENKAEMLKQAGDENESRGAHKEAAGVLGKRADILRENGDYKGEAGTYRRIADVLSGAGETEGAAEALRLAGDADRVLLAEN
ncbi:MAG: hypothetical protein ABIG39_07600 [Candidatus Micrarchaeota archaeon]